MSNGTEKMEEKIKEKRNVAPQVFVDCILLLICGGIVPIVWHCTTPTRQGFFCDDENIMYPEKENTITNAILWSFCTLVPLGIICLTEVVRKFTVMEIEVNEIYFFRWKVPHMIQEIYSFGGVLFIGLLMSELSNDFIKSFIGRPRPNFLALCKPDFNCSSVANPHYYVTEYKCTNPNLLDEKYFRESFPSGHAALTTYSMFYIVFYLHKKVTFTRYSVLAKPLILWMLLMPTGYITLTRLADHMHHWDDILAGFFLGFFICVALIFTMTDLYKNK
ncbi:putative phosphatidate phosphatase [Parasteatoda tepidariorum]|uniref:putative phosphatidate phosphatase n=1 Tax=Parasteatoda tepidariorum TaxID=114398 RepID=UPI001C72692D|nr:putative phosphatidate phosphatase [Parasteatoda tepidariorum]